ncbi:GGDEF domain-containing protein [Streptomyces cylindrosporus]|uniref:GGDEF domain-containing protein n=1 Tax=Streptomyces cylindrosporus TaxID=2927583 RepID=A0ABS9YGD4_9ACTN|nr:GGDEF domain-containing protein [Streptomyces cylindrosporus]MCI3276255.1 GGDEF domain-containing protein [Streptomyces cylindrosporus]
MTDPITLTAALPLAGWAAHSLWMARRLRIARTDPLTGLPTRDPFTARALRTVARGRASVLLLDVDHFKHVNDTHGHAAGDALLAAIGGRLQEWSSEYGGFAGRLGGDEFAAVAHLDDLATHALDVLADRLQRCVDIDGHLRLSPRVSVGVCRPDDRPGLPLDARLRAADEAMYAAKSLGRRWRYAEPQSTHTTTAGRRAGRRGTHTSLSSR